MNNLFDAKRISSIQTSFMVLIGFFCLVLTGCGDAALNQVLVSGTVLIDNEPLPNAYVKFIPTEGRPSLATTDEMGRFTLTCHDENDGVVIGKHRMTVKAIDQISSTSTRWRSPKIYSSLETTPLECEITESKDDMKVELSWQGGKPFIENY